MNIFANVKILVRFRAVFNLIPKYIDSTIIIANTNNHTRVSFGKANIILTLYSS